MTKKDWTEQLREQLADYKAEVPEGLWADIEQRLPQQKPVVATLWQRWVGIAALVALLFGIGWWQWPEEQAPDKHLAQTQNEQLTEQKQDLRENPVRTARTASSHVTYQEFAPYGLMPDTLSVNSLLSEQDNTQQELPIKEQPIKEQPQHNLSQHSFAQDSPLPSIAKKRRMVSVGLMANNGLMAYQHTNGVQMSPEMASRFDFGDYLSTRSTSNDEPIWLVGYEERQHHSHPISFGLTIGYPLSSRWTLSTGLVYTRLNSQFINILSNTPITTDQRLDYVGVPLNVQYHILKGKGWKAYASAGAQIDWNISSKKNIEGVDVQSKKDYPQWSLGGAVGVEYDIIPIVGIYAEPGFRYYLQNDSKVKNFFKDQPLNWTLQVGIRLNLGKDNK